LTIIQAIVLGIVQGLTEFIPVSSSAHLVLVPWLLGWSFDSDAAFVFDVLVQWGTLLGVFIYFWKDIRSIIGAMFKGLAQRRPFASFDARLGWWLALATIPAVIVGALFKEQFEASFSSPLLVALFLFGTAAILIIAERFGKRERDLSRFNTVDATVMGLAQVLALFPGVSRSGATIGGGMLRQLDRPAAARFSFLMAIPVMLGAGVIAIKDLFDNAALLSSLAAPLIVGFLAAAISGYVCIRWLLAYLQQRSLGVFAIYCVAFGAFNLVIALIRQ
jgi:undecaprenyl-diphosphatase